MTIEERANYMKEYNKTYKYFKGTQSSDVAIMDVYDRTHLLILPTQINFKGNDRDEPIVCAGFGCRVHLSPEQQLYNRFCYTCQCKKK